MSEQQLDMKQIGTAVTDTIAAIAFETARRVIEQARQRRDVASAMTVRELETIVRGVTGEVLCDYFLGEFKALPYVISDDGTSITCVRCGLTSHNANDVKQRYCGQCKRFFDDG